MQAKRALLMLSTIFVACTSSKDEVDYYPLKPGMTWEYSVRTGTQFDETLSVTAEGEEVIGGKTYTKVRVISSDERSDAKPNYFRYRKTKDGVWVYSEGDGREELLLPLPPTVGKRWETPTSNNLIKSFEDVTIASRKYENCLHVAAEHFGGRPAGTENQPGLGDSMDLYFAPGIGLIKMTGEHPRGDYYMVLTGYSTNMASNDTKRSQKSEDSMGSSKTNREFLPETDDGTRMAPAPTPTPTPTLTPPM